MSKDRGSGGHEDFQDVGTPDFREPSTRSSPVSPESGLHRRNFEEPAGSDRPQDHPTKPKGEIRRNRDASEMSFRSHSDSRGAPPDQRSGFRQETSAGFSFSHTETERRDILEAAEYEYSSSHDGLDSLPQRPSPTGSFASERDPEGRTPEAPAKYPGMATTALVQEAMKFLERFFGEDCIERMANHETKRRNLEREREDLLEANRNLQQQLRESDRHQKSRAQDAESKIEDLQKQVQNERLRSAELQARVDKKESDLSDATARIDSVTGENNDLRKRLRESEIKPRIDLLKDVEKAFGVQSDLHALLSRISDPHRVMVVGNCCLYLLPRPRPQGISGAGPNTQHLMALGVTFLEFMHQLDINERSDLLNAAANLFSQADGRCRFHSVEGGQFNSSCHEGKPTRQGQKIRRMLSFLVTAGANQVVSKAKVELED